MDTRDHACSVRKRIMYQRSIGKHFFISHSSKDKEIARKLRKDLEAKGLPTWMDDDILPGEPWDRIVETAIIQSIAVLYLVSPTSHSSPMVAAELDMADYHERRMIPLWIGGEKWKDVVIMGYGRMHYLDLRGSRYEEKISVLYSELLSMQDGSGPGPLPPVLPPGPGPLSPAPPPVPVKP